MLDDLVETFRAIIAPNEIRGDTSGQVKAKVEELLTPHVIDETERARLVAAIMRQSEYVTDYAVYVHRVIEGERSEKLGDW